MLTVSLLSLLSLAAPCTTDDAPATAWTILVYGAVDNDWESPFMRDIRRMRAGLEGVQDVEVLLLIDRSDEYTKDSRSLGEDFADTRLYRLSGGSAERLAGAPELAELTLESTAELDLSDASTLQRFVQYGKRRFPAEHTALWLVSHGEGMSFCPDETDEGQMFTAELTAVLGEADSVDMLGFDACLMAGVENGYEWRPAADKFGAEVLLAAPPLSSSWPYEEIFARLRQQPDAEAAGTSVLEASAPAPADEERGALDPSTMSSLQFAHMIVDELDHQIRSGRSGDRGIERDLQAWGAYDLRAVEATKQDVDALARQLWQDQSKDELLRLRGAGLEAPTYVYVWPERNADIHMPFVDLAHLCQRIAASEDFSEKARALATTALGSTDELVAHSVGFDHYTGFRAGLHGLYLIFPDGDKTTRRGQSYWQRTDWYSPLALEDDSGAYGRYAWCADGAIAGNGKVENWFELMDACFDLADEDGGHNGYSW